MPTGPNGEKRPADVVGCAVTVMRIATGETEETGYKQPEKRKGGRAGGRARARALTSKERAIIARQGAAARWAPEDKFRNMPVPFDFPQRDLFIEHQLEGEVVPQRPRDGYINATLLCQRANKLFADYYRLSRTTAFLDALSADMGNPISALVQVVKGGNDKLVQGTWVHPRVAINLGQWLSPEFDVKVSQWVFDWLNGTVQSYMPEHVRRYLKNRTKIPPDHFSMLNEIYLNFLAPLEDFGVLPPDKIMPDISTGRMFSGFLRTQGIDPSEFPNYWHEFTDDSRRTVQARLYPIKYLEEFRKYFNDVWLPRHAEKYLAERFPRALPYVSRIRTLPSSNLPQPVLNA